MPLYDSLNASQIYRLPKMNSVPTTDDLRYAIAEGQKRIGKTIELVFEHPSNHQIFVVKLVLSVGNKTPPSWTLFRGDSPNAPRMWNRASEDVLMVQNKIKIDCQYVPQDGEPEPMVTSQPMSLQVNAGGGGMDMDNPLAPGSSAQAEPGAPPAPVSHNAFSQAQQQQVINAFQAPPQMAPAFGDNWADSLVQPPVFNPNSSRTNIPAMHPGTPQPVASGPKPAAPLPLDQVPGNEPNGTHAAEQAGHGAQAAATAPPTAPGATAAASPSAESGAPKTALPPPIKLDVTLIDRVNSLLVDPNTTLHSFATFVHFLFREHATYKRSNVPFSIVIFEVALRIGYENVALPAIALPTIIERVNAVASEFDIVTHLSGGEFAALLPGLDSAAVSTWAQNLHTAVTSEPLSAGNRNEGVLAAVGMATMPQTCDDPEVLIAAARQAKETAKTLPVPILLFPA